MGQLSARNVVVTGGNGGIGLSMAMSVGAAGANVVIWGRSAEKNERALEALRSQGVSAHAFVCDVSDEAQVLEMLDASAQAVDGRIDAVFANAGSSGSSTDVLELPLAEWRTVITDNLDTTFITLRAAARRMVADGDGGALVAVSSCSAILGAAQMVAYGAAKTGVLGLVRALAVRLATSQIRVNALLPGWTLTDMATPSYDDERLRRATIRHTPVRRWAHPDEMGPAAVFLADPTITFHTGDSLVIDGGLTIG